MKRALFNIAATLSLVLWLATMSLWLQGAVSRGWVTEEDWIRSTYFDKTYGLASIQGQFTIRWMEILGPNEPRIVSGDYIQAEDRSFAFVRAPEGIAPGFSQRWSRHGCLAFPYWSAAVASAILPAWWLALFIRHRRRRNPLMCRRCGYDLRATPHRCPECGTVPQSPEIATSPADAVDRAGV